MSNPFSTELFIQEDEYDAPTIGMKLTMAGQDYYHYFKSPTSLETVLDSRNNTIDKVLEEHNNNLKG